MKGHSCEGCDHACAEQNAVTCCWLAACKVSTGLAEYSTC